jgi:hypothetical protein
VSLYTSNGIEKEKAVVMANSMISSEFNADAIAKLTGTYVAGGAGVQLNVSGGGKK